MMEKLNLPPLTVAELAAVKQYQREIGAWYNACDPKCTAGSWQFAGALALYYQKQLAERPPAPSGLQER